MSLISIINEFFNFFIVEKYFECLLFYESFYKILVDRYFLVSQRTLNYIQLHLFFFFLFISIVILFSLFLIFITNPIYSVISLIVVYLFSAFILIVFEVHFLAIVFVLVYLGAVVVLFLFIVMMLNIKIQTNLKFFNIIPLIFLILVSIYFFKNFFFYRELDFFSYMLNPIPKYYDKSFYLISLNDEKNNSDLVSKFYFSDKILFNKNQELFSYVYDKFILEADSGNENCFFNDSYNARIKQITKSMDYMYFFMNFCNFYSSFKLLDCFIENNYLFDLNFKKENYILFGFILYSYFYMEIILASFILLLAMIGCITLTLTKGIDKLKSQDPMEQLLHENAFLKRKVFVSYNKVV